MKDKSKNWKKASKKYSIHTMQDEYGDFFFALFEEETEQVIDFFYFEDDVIKVHKFMTQGGAFNGFTPPFMLKRVKVENLKSELNEKVNSLFP